MIQRPPYIYTFLLNIFPTLPPQMTSQKRVNVLHKFHEIIRFVNLDLPESSLIGWKFSVKIMGKHIQMNLDSFTGTLHFSHHFFFIFIVRGLRFRRISPSLLLN